MKRSSLARWVRLAPALLLVGMLVGPAIGTASAGGSGRDHINIKLFTFRPNYLRVSPGEVITVANRDGDHFGEPHSLTAEDGSFDTGVFVEGSRDITAPTELGNHKYYCTVHPFMKGVFHVAPGR